MAGILKKTIRLGLIVGVVAGGATLLAGPDRVHALFTQVQNDVQSAIESTIDDPVELRHQLRKLEKEYPKRITTVRKDLAGLEDQRTELKRDQQVALRVVRITEEDLAALEDQLSHIPAAYEDGYARPAGLTPVAKIRRDRLQTRINQVQQTRLTYANQAQSIERELVHLNRQAQMFEEALLKLETEYSAFKAQSMQLEREIDAVARNERLIELMEKRQRVLDELTNFNIGSLDHMTARLGQIRAEQEAELEILSSSDAQISYEDRARLELQSEGLDQGQLEPAEVQTLDALGYATAEDGF
ncbi:MAG: hypothetical protein DWQ01_19210 [Planctomycetota bacterium]|nr:MAG: hypothetical protein DWQ01_19210 [Planctomycetota bacterium]